jgi:hypothetical protein
MRSEVFERGDWMTRQSSELLAFRSLWRSQILTSTKDKYRVCHRKWRQEDLFSLLTTIIFTDHRIDTGIAHWKSPQTKTACPFPIRFRDEKLRALFVEPMSRVIKRQLIVVLMIAIWSWFDFVFLLEMLWRVAFANPSLTSSSLSFRVSASETEDWFHEEHPKI